MGNFFECLCGIVRRREKSTLRLVATKALFGAAAVHIIDIDSRRLVFASSSHSICLLDKYAIQAAAPFDEDIDVSTKPRGEEPTRKQVENEASCVTS